MSCSGFSVLIAVEMKSAARTAPALIALAAVVIAGSLPLISQWFPTNFLQALEWDAYDWRMRRTAAAESATATNLAAIYLDEESIEFLGNVLRAYWPYPRQVHGRLIRELTRQGAKGVAIDVLFAGSRPMDAPVPAPEGKLEESDDFFTRQLRESGNVIIAEGEKAVPTLEFATAALAVGDITIPRDADGVIRRIRPVRLDEHGDRHWHMGILLAARELGLRMDQAEIGRRQIILPRDDGSRLRIPLDERGMMLVDWNLVANDRRLTLANFGMVVGFDLARELEGEAGYQALLAEYRQQGRPDLDGDRPLAGKLVVVGSVAEGSNVTDVGPTPLSENSPLVATHLNVANALIMGRFIQPMGTVAEMILVMLLGLASSVITWRTRVTYGAAWMVTLAAGMVLASVWAFQQQRFWIPLINPVVGGLLIPYVALVSYRVIFEEREQRRIKQVFKRVVSPDVVNELLAAEHLSLGGARRNITVFFADVRGFTEMTDSTHARAEEYVRQNQLSAGDAEAYFEQNAREVLATINLYLGTISDIIKKHHGTLDKYIGDCVMAFWGAPIANEQHAVACVRAAVEAQRAIFRLNQERAAENERRKAAAGPIRDLTLLPLLTLGTGINSGIATVGLMGSEEHTFSYTVFGREVNLASRLEGFSGRGRIIVGANTYTDLQRFAPELAAGCVQQEPASFKGFKESIITYEVPWRETSPVPSPPGST